MKRIFAAVLLIGICSLAVFSQTESRADLLKDIETKRAELAELEKKFLAPSEDDRAKYVQFLAQPNTGLIRLLPRETFDSYANKKSGMTTRGGGAYYSFSRQTHEYGFATEIGLEQGYLKTGFGGADYGMFTKLDGARLEDLTTDLPAAIFLAKYSAVANEPEARIEQRRFATGATIDGFAYKGRLAVENGATYLLRSITFEEADVLVAFTIVRQDTDGSLILAWKLLQKYQVPKLALNK